MDAERVALCARLRHSVVPKARPCTPAGVPTPQQCTRLRAGHLDLPPSRMRPVCPAGLQEKMRTEGTGETRTPEVGFPAAKVAEEEGAPAGQPKGQL